MRQSDGRHALRLRSNATTHDLSASYLPLPTQIPLRIELDRAALGRVQAICTITLCVHTACKVFVTPFRFTLSQDISDLPQHMQSHSSLPVYLQRHWARISRQFMHEYRKLGADACAAIVAVTSQRTSKVPSVIGTLINTTSGQLIIINPRGGGRTNSNPIIMFLSWNGSSMNGLSMAEDRVSILLYQVPVQQLYGTSTGMQYGATVYKQGDCVHS